MSVEAEQNATHAELIGEKQYNESAAGWLFRLESYKYSSYQVDFYNEEYKKLPQLIEIFPDDVILDVGCFNGQNFIQAIQANKINAHLIGVDPYDRAYQERLLG